MARFMPFMREFPKFTEVRDLYEEDKWKQFDNVLDEAVSQKADGIVVAYPDVLGDTHLELLLNLSKISTKKLILGIASPSPFLKQTGVIKLD